MAEVRYYVNLIRLWNVHHAVAQAGYMVITHLSVTSVAVMEK